MMGGCVCSRKLKLAGYDLTSSAAAHHAAALKYHAGLAAPANRLHVRYENGDV